MRIALEVENLSILYGAIEAVIGVSLAVKEGEVVAVIGANGAGKSSLLNAIAGLVKIAAGSVRVDGAEIRGWPAERIARSGVGLVPEGRRTFTRLTVEENLRLGGYFLAAEAFRRRAEEMFEIFPVLMERLHSYAGHLSGGEQQMLAIARSLMAHPRILLLDEPSAGLSPIATAAVYGSLQGYAAQSKATMLLVEQNVKWAFKLAQRGYVLELGRVKLTGSIDELDRDPRVAELYLGLES
jgi:branched-chain amino acid transport system ATP-binding protein